MNISVSKLKQARDNLMEILDFTPINKISDDINNNDITPWGFIQNIICSKTNNQNIPKCRNTFNPNITLTIDSETTHACKDYIFTKLQNYCEHNACTKKKYK